MPSWELTSSFGRRRHLPLCLARDHGEDRIRQGYLSDLETKRRKGLDSTMERLAAALEVPVAWIA